MGFFKTGRKKGIYTKVREEDFQRAIKAGLKHNFIWETGLNFILKDSAHFERLSRVEQENETRKIEYFKLLKLCRSLEVKLDVMSRQRGVK